MFAYRSRFLTRGEVWFDEEPDGRRVDWVLYRQCSRPIPKSRWRFFYTRLIDLSKSPDQLLAEMKKSTATGIREATDQDQTSVEAWEPKSPKIMDRFEAMWNQFAAARGSARLDQKWLGPMIHASALDLTAARSRGGELLAVQATYRHAHRARQLMVVSPFQPQPSVAMRKKIHRANCLLHWETMLRMKECGVGHFDFGGWYPGNTDIQLLGINAFKESFGGAVRREYECKRILTLKGWIVLSAARLLRKTRDPHRSRTPILDANIDANTKTNELSAAIR